jgi:hypothetical protein
MGRKVGATECVRPRGPNALVAAGVRMHCACVAPVWAPSFPPAFTPHPQSRRPNPPTQHTHPPTHPNTYTSRGPLTYHPDNNTTTTTKPTGPKILLPFLGGAAAALLAVSADFALFKRRLTKQQEGPAVAAGEEKKAKGGSEGGGFSFGIDHLPSELKLVVCAGGIYASYLTVGERRWLCKEASLSIRDF